MRVQIRYLLFAFTFFFSSTFCQPHLISIPIGLETTPTGNDAFFPYQQIERPKLALALSGGGARGLAHIGVLKVLERHGIPVDAIAGTSMGAVIGALASVGYSASQIDSIAHTINWNEIIKDAPPRKQLFLGQKEQKSKALLQIRFEKLSLDFQPAYTAGQKMSTVLTEIFLKAPCPFVSDFYHLPIPLKIIATDLLTGQKYVFSKGSLVDACRASMAIPLLFTPLETEGKLLVDGGLVENIPVQEAKTMNADIVLAVDVSSKLRPKNALKAPWEIADQVTTIMQQNDIQEQLEKADVVIQPSLEGISNMDFDHMDEIITIGEQSGEAVVDRIEALLLKSKETFEDFKKDYLIDHVHFSGFTFLSPESLLTLPFFSKNKFTFSEISWTGKSLYQTGYFENIRLELDTLRHILYVQVKENPKIHHIQFQGNTVFSDSILRQCITTKEGSLLNFQNGRQDVKSILSMYHKQGYVLANIQKTEIIDSTLIIHVDEGKISRITFQGLQRTKPFVVRREILLHPGNIFHADLLKQSMENFYSTEYFESVRYRILSEGQNHTLVFIFKEKGFTLFRAGLHQDNQKKWQTLMEWVEENAFGIGVEGNVTGKWGTRDRKLTAGFRTNQIFNTLMTAQIQGSLGSEDFTYYESLRKKGEYRISIAKWEAMIGQQMRRLGTLSLQFVRENLSLMSLNGTAPLGEQFSLFTMKIKSEVDTRDRLPFPNSGKYHILEYETAGKFLGSQISYTKLSSSMESFYPLQYKIVFHPRIFWGTADLTTPFPKQYHLGGMDTFMGLPEDAMLGRQFIVCSGELRYTLPYPKWFKHYVHLRYDLGSMWTKYSHISTKDFKQGIGFLFSIQTPLGPIQSGMGWMSDGKKAFYFSAGYRF